MPSELRKGDAMDLLTMDFHAQQLKPEREYRFCERRWKFDFAFPEKMVAVEVEGGTWGTKSRHTSGKGFEGDCHKYNTATLKGWKVLRFTTTMVQEGALDTILEALR